MFFWSAEPEKKIMGTYIEGVGDDLIAVLIGLCVVGIPLIYLLWKWIGIAGNSAVHAESESLAGDVREQMRTDRLAQPSAPPSHPEQTQNGHAAPSSSFIRTQNDIRCPICIDDTKFAVQTNCGHIFCGQCFVTWWQHGRWTGAAKCPVCRQQVTLILRYFSEVERRTDTEEKQELIRNINLYNRRFSGQPLSWMEYLRDLPTILRHCLSDFFTIGGIMWMFRLRILVCFVFALLYLVSPLDIIPEAVFGFFGLLDDLFIAILFAIYVSIIYRRFIMIRAQAGQSN